MLWRGSLLQQVASERDEQFALRGGILQCTCSLHGIMIGSRGARKGRAQPRPAQAGGNKLRVKSLDFQMAGVDYRLFGTCSERAHKALSGGFQISCHRPMKLAQQAHSFFGTRVSRGAKIAGHSMPVRFRPRAAKHVPLAPPQKRSQVQLIPVILLTGDIGLRHHESISSQLFSNPAEPLSGKLYSELLQMPHLLQHSGAPDFVIKNLHGDATKPRSCCKR
mmetsp:Transcript_2888/g.6556  ORF Transcript_2888/g.6556 Transcript_2888/m.6556 type:complete len:221 (+) Transcript_2888:303-965(+)